MPKECEGRSVSKFSQNARKVYRQASVVRKGRRGGGWSRTTVNQSEKGHGEDCRRDQNHLKNIDCCLDLQAADLRRQGNKEMLIRAIIEPGTA